MTQTPEEQCGHNVVYDFGSKAARCGTFIDGHPLLCDSCRTLTEIAKRGPADTVRSVCQAALRCEHQALETAQERLRNLLEQTQLCESELAKTRARIADLDAFLAAQ